MRPQPIRQRPCFVSPARWRSGRALVARASRLDADAGLQFDRCGVAEARLEERRVVAPVLAGSTPVSHPGAIDGREVMVIGAASRAASSLFDSGRGRQQFV